MFREFIESFARAVFLSIVMPFAVGFILPGTTATSSGSAAEYQFDEKCPKPWPQQPVRLKKKFVCLFE